MQLQSSTMSAHLVLELLSHFMYRIQLLLTLKESRAQRTTYEHDFYKLRQVLKPLIY